VKPRMKVGGGPSKKKGSDFNLQAARRRFSSFGDHVDEEVMDDRVF
jgi:hypothetical protein